MSRIDATPPAVLIVEDDSIIGRHLQVGLQANGYTTTWCRTGTAARIHARETGPAIVLLDLGLPDIDGVDLARDLRRDHPNLLLIILTARSDEIDIIVGLDAGADDYLVKPFTLTVLLARLRAHLRRRPPSSTDPAIIRLGGLIIDRTAHRCILNGREVALRGKEFDLLASLAGRPGTAITREQLMNDVWDENWYGSTKTLDVTMASLRRRLAEACLQAGGSDADAPVITTLRGHGYRIELTNPTSASGSTAGGTP